MTDFSKILSKAKELEAKMKESQENIKKISIGKKEKKLKQKHQDPVMESKHKDLFDELFGDSNDS